MMVDEEILLALKRSRLTVAKMQARQQVIQNQIEDIKTDTELLLGPFSAEAERIVEAGEKVYKNHQEIIDAIASWNTDLKLIVDSMLEEQGVPSEEFAEIHEAVTKFMSQSATYEHSSLKEMTESVEIMTQARADLKRAAAGE